MEANPVPPEAVEGQRRQARRALFILSCLMVTLGMMLPRLLPSPRPTFDPRHILPRVDHAAKRTIENDNAQDTVTLMQEHLQRGGCMWPGSGWITGLLLTSDGRLVLSNWHAKTLTVKSSFAEVVIPLPVQPLAVTLLEKDRSSSSSSSSSSSRVAVTSGSNEILLVDIDQPDLPLETITTGDKSYSHVTSGLNDDTLIVSTVANPQGQVSVDLITLQGDVIETLTDTARCPDLRFVHFLTKDQEDNIFISALDRNNESTLICLHQSVSQESTTPQRWEAENLHYHVHVQDRLPQQGHLWGTAGHGRWGIFIGQDGGVVLRKKRDGELVAVVDQTDPYFNPTVLAVSEDKLFVVWDHYYVGDFVMVEYYLKSLY